VGHPRGPGCGTLARHKADGYPVMGRIGGGAMARSELESQGSAEWRGMLLHPSTLLLVAVDAIPALGVVFWHGTPSCC
jgi:hypothetical protein